VSKRSPRERAGKVEAGDELPRGRADGNFLIVLFLGAGFLFFLFFVFRVAFPSHAVVPYSVVLSELRRQNVAKIEATGHSLAITLKAAIGVSTGTGTVETVRVRAEHPSFATNDQAFLEMVDQQGVELTVVRDDGNWYGLVVLVAAPLALLMLFWIYMSNRNREDLGGIFNIGRSKARAYDAVHRTGVTFEDVAGLEAVRGEVSEIVEFLKTPEKFTRLGGRMPKGILLTGPPGSGKTLLAKALAGEAGVPFFSISGSEFIEMFVGVGASRVRDLFARAVASAPAIVFIDEIDAVGRTRGTGLGRAHDEREQTLNQMLSEMDGFDPHLGVVVVAATNRPDVLDPALLRPGRFDRQLVIPLPERAGRAKILAIHARGKPLGPDVDLAEVARGTPGFSGADLANVVNEAAIQAAREGRDLIGRADFDEARDKAMMGTARPDLVRSEKDRRRVALHEAGHALLARILPHADPVHKVSIIPRGRALGVTQQLPDEDRTNLTRAYLLDSLTMLLGGRAAEDLDDPATVSTGAEHDFERTAHLARRMVARWGMSPRIGPLSFDTEIEHPFLGLEVQQHRNFSDATARAIDEEVARVVRWCYARATRHLAANRATLDALVEALLADESLERERFLALCEGARLAEDPTFE